MPFRAKVLKPLNQPVIKRLSHSKRGYDRAHEKWRIRILLRDPICVICNRIRSEHADHIQTIRERPDLKLDLQNGRGVCAPCHSRLTVQYDGGFGRQVKDKT